MAIRSPGPSPARATDPPADRPRPRAAWSMTSPSTVDQRRPANVRPPAGRRPCRQTAGCSSGVGHAMSGPVSDPSRLAVDSSARRRVRRVRPDLRGNVGRVRVCIVGAGAIGGLLGARLARSPASRSSVLARGDNLDGDPVQRARRSSSRTASTWRGTGGRRRRRPRRLRPAGRRRAGGQGAPDRRRRRVAGPRCTTTTRSSCPLQNGVPWWFFQRFPGPYEGTAAASRSTRTARSSATSPPSASSACIAYPAAERDEPGVIRLSRATGSRSASSTASDPSGSRPSPTR